MSNFSEDRGGADGVGLGIKEGKKRAVIIDTAIRGYFVVSKLDLLEAA